MSENDVCVQVAVRIRPQIPRELIEMCRICTQVVPGEPQITIGSDKSFTYDYVFDMNESQTCVYETCVQKLVDSSLEGYNATVFAYGQTGSGKTYTMGTGFGLEIPEDLVGIIPRAVNHLFDGIESRIRQAHAAGEMSAKFKISAQFIEIYNEEVIDLFDPIKNYNVRKAIKIHEDANGDIHISGISQKPIECANDAFECLKIGALSRRTASTQMNSQSSRSHAIFTLVITQKRICRDDDLTESGNSPEFETLSSKFHFVDLAGSERMKRTGATGERAKEGISINCGLMVLGNVISALAGKNKKSHIPYRDSKLTRLLQDSLGGNSQTLMIACISPSDSDFVETLNTLKYANRAKEIKNKVVINKDKSSQTIMRLRQEIAHLQMELLEFKQGKRLVGSDGSDEVSDMFLANKMMENELNHLRNRIKAMQETINVITMKNTELMANRIAATWNGDDNSMTDLIQNYIKEIEELRAKFMESEFTCQNLRKQIAHLQTNLSMNHSQRELLIEDTISSLIERAKHDLDKQKLVLNQSTEHTDPGEEHDDDDEKDTNDNSCDSESDSDDKSDHCLDTQLSELSVDIDIKQKLIEELEKSQKRIELMKDKYENKLHQLEIQINDTQAERDRVLKNLTNQSNEPEKVKLIKEKYERKIVEMQTELKKLQAAKKEHNKLVKDHAMQENQLRTLKNDLAGMKRTKVKLINQMKEESARHRSAENQRLREISQLQKESRRNAKRILTMQVESRQKEQVLKRKHEEALRKMNRAQQIINKTSTPKISSKNAQQKWRTLEKYINKAVLSKQVIAYQERDMNRLVLKRESLSRNLERLRQRKLFAQDLGEDLSDINNEIDAILDELNYVQDSIIETQHNIVQIDQSKENPDVGDIQALANSIQSVNEARYVMNQLLNFALSQSYMAAQRDIQVKDKDTELEQMKQEHKMTYQLLDYMVDNVDAMQVSISASNTTNEASSSTSSSRSTSPAPFKLALTESPSINDIQKRVRRRAIVPRETLLGLGSTN